MLVKRPSSILRQMSAVWDLQNSHPDSLTNTAVCKARTMWLEDIYLPITRCRVSAKHASHSTSRASNTMPVKPSVLQDELCSVVVVGYWSGDRKMGSMAASCTALIGQLFRRMPARAAKTLPVGVRRQVYLCPGVPVQWQTGPDVGTSRKIATRQALCTSREDASDIINSPFYRWRVLEVLYFLVVCAICV